MFGSTPTFLAVMCLVAAILVGLDCIWRMKGRLSRFTKLLTVGVIFAAAESIGQLLGFAGSAGWAPFLSLGTAAFILLALLELYRIVRILDHEKQAPPSSRK